VGYVAPRFQDSGCPGWVVFLLAIDLTLFDVVGVDLRLILILHLQWLLTHADSL
jgi:hypothetical protein